MIFESDLVGGMAGFIEVLLMFDELNKNRKNRARELIREFHIQMGFPYLNEKSYLREPQDNISESQALAVSNWSVGDWAVFDLKIVQIMEIRDYENGCEVSDGSFRTSGRLMTRLRPLTLRNKRTAEYFDWWYNELRKVKGERGFNYPDINQHFCSLALAAMDGPENDSTHHDLASSFLQDARDRKEIIQGVELFR